MSECNADYICEMGTCLSVETPGACLCCVHHERRPIAMSDATTPAARTSLQNHCVYCLEDDDRLDSDGVCPECREEFDNRDALYEQELADSLEFDVDEEADSE